MKTLHIVAHVPPETPLVCLPGSLPELGPWNPRLYRMQGEGGRREAILEVPAGMAVEFKFTAGSWAREAVDEHGERFDNFRVEVTDNTVFEVTLAGFRSGAPRPGEQAGVIGDLVYHLDVASAHLELPRHVAVRLPLGYHESDRRYPVLYMHDGQNIFDPELSNTGIDWGIDESIARLVASGEIPDVIVVGIFNTDHRYIEYSPWHNGAGYARFIIEELKPMIDATYRTQPGRDTTAVMGSSMGGLISLYLGWKHPEVFGRIGCVSTHFPWYADMEKREGDTILDVLEREGPEALSRNLRIYFDYGTVGIDALYPPFNDRLRAMLESWGWVEGERHVIVKFDGADHNEQTWRERLDIPVKFLLSDLPRD